MIDNDEYDDDYQPDIMGDDDYKPPKKVKKLKIKMKRDYDENNGETFDGTFDEDKPIKRKKKRGPKPGGTKIKVRFYCHISIPDLPSVVFIVHSLL